MKRIRAIGSSFVISALVFAVAPVSCSAPLEFPDWTIPVPEGTPVHEYAAVSLDERQGNRIEVEEDLILGGDDTDPQQAFYRATDVVPDAAGNIYVLDRGDHHVRVFNADGAYVRTLGRQGQGPGEFPSPRAVVITRDRVVVLSDQRRLSTWSLDGEHVGDSEIASAPWPLVGVDDGFVGRTQDWLGELSMSAPPARRFTFALYGAEGQQGSVYAHVDQPTPALIDSSVPRADFYSGVLLGRGGVLPTFHARFAASRDGTLYLTTSEEYQVHAYGARRWSLRVAWEREEVTDEHVANEMAGYWSRSLPDAPASIFDWPERFEAITSLLVDGHGHIYVFPFHEPLDAPGPPSTEAPETASPRVDRPVDVFSVDGEHLFSGMISLANWTGALGDFVYGSRLNEGTEEHEVVRYRLVEPFE